MLSYPQKGDEIMKKIPERSEIAQKDKWAIEDLYASPALWQEDLKKLQQLGQELAAFSGKIHTSASNLLAYMRLNDQVAELYDSLGNYAYRKSDEDTRVAENQALLGQIAKAGVELGEQTSFEVPELLSIPDETMEQFYQDVPELELYRRHFGVIRRKREHILSEKEEKLLAAAGEMAGAPHRIFSLFSNADMTFPDALDAEGKPHQITQGTYIPCMQSADRVLRKNAFESFYGVYGNYQNSLSGMLCAQVKQLEFFAKARNYPSAQAASLDATEVPVSVYSNLIDTVHRNFDKMYRYMRLRKRLMGLDELHFYDIYTPLLPDVDVQIPYEEAKKTVCEALSCLGEDYGKILREGFENRWIDVYENVGKRSGAYSAGAHVHPYVLLNYSGSLDSQFTLAHEMGHALHSYLSNRTQPVVYQDYVIFVAEVASTCNEALLMQHLLQKTTDKRQRAYLINYFLEQFRTTLYRQTMFAEFELRIAELSQQGQTLTAELLCDEYRKLNEAYYGPDIVLDKEIALEWARIPHFYYNYYVFQYATGYSAAIALSKKILAEGAPAVANYLGFLSGGCSKTPIELLRGAGVDMTTPQPVESALSLFGELLDEMEALLP